MITEEYLRKSHVFRRLKNGPQGQIVELYAARLVKDDFAGAITRRHLLWLGHESIDTTQIFLHAHLARKEAKLKPYERRKGVRFKPSDRLLAFLEAL